MVGHWETHETLTTDGDGYVSFSGFKGGYTVQAEAGSAGFTLEKDLDDRLTLKA